MNILSIDTASDICGVSILKDTKAIEILDTCTGRTHSENLMPMIKEILEKNNLNLTDIDLIVCDIGPGSFTGIRIGIATIKAFSDSLNIPCIGVNSLESLACSVLLNVPDTEFICSIIDCKNDNCYFSLFENVNGTINTLIEPQADNIPSALSILNSYCEDTLNSPGITFVGGCSDTHYNEIKKEFPSAVFASKKLNSLNSYSLGIAGYNKYISGISDQDILPLYLKKSQAEIQLEKKEKQK